MSLVEAFNTLEELKAYPDSVAIVGTAGNSRSTGVEGSGIPFTVTDVTATASLWGDSAAPVFPVRQLGDDAAISEDTTPLLVKGEEYILFLKPFSFVKGEPTGQYVILGERAAWRREGPAFRILRNETGLPRVVTEEDIARR